MRLVLTVLPAAGSWGQSRAATEATTTQEVKNRTSCLLLSDLLLLPHMGEPNWKSAGLEAERFSLHHPNHPWYYRDAHRRVSWGPQIKTNTDSIKSSEEAVGVTLER